MRPPSDLRRYYFTDSASARKCRRARGQLSRKEERAAPACARGSCLPRPWQRRSPRTCVRGITALFVEKCLTNALIGQRTHGTDYVLAIIARICSRICRATASNGSMLCSALLNQQRPLIPSGLRPCRQPSAPQFAGSAVPHPPGCSALPCRRCRCPHRASGHCRPWRHA
jgi:hypothetical protein